MNPFLLAGALFTAIGLLQMAQDEHDKQQKPKPKQLPKAEKPAAGNPPVTVNVNASEVQSKKAPKQKPKPPAEVPDKPTDG